jgi:hypothetical protein
MAQFSSTDVISIRCVRQATNSRGHAGLVAQTSVLRSASPRTISNANHVCFRLIGKFSAQPYSSLQALEATASQTFDD